MFRLAACFVAIALLFHGPQGQAEERGTIIDSMDVLSFKPTSEKCKVQLVPGREGGALQFTFEKDARSSFAVGKSRGQPDWEQAEGISFWVRGDGTEQFAGLQFIWNEDYALRYDYGFWVRGNEWTKVVVPWRDLLPVTSKEGAQPVAAGKNSPSKLGPMWFGKWWYWRDYPALSFAVDDIRLEAKVPLAGIAPTAAAAGGDGLARVRAKLRDGKPLEVVTMGDSLTDTAHWANREVNWPMLFNASAAERFKSTVKLVNPAIGGTELRQNLVLIPRWTHGTPRPDLVTVCFGGNDYNSGMRGKMYHATMCDAIDRIRRATGGEAEVLVMTTCPGADAWDTYADLAEAARLAAKEKHAGLADTYSAFHAVEKSRRDGLFVNDRVHLSPAGHRLVADTVLQAISPRPE